MKRSQEAHWETWSFVLLRKSTDNEYTHTDIHTQTYTPTRVTIQTMASRHGNVQFDINVNALIFHEKKFHAPNKPNFRPANKLEYDYIPVTKVNCCGYWSLATGEHPVIRPQYVSTSELSDVKHLTDENEKLKTSISVKSLPRLHLNIVEAIIQ